MLIVVLHITPLYLQPAQSSRNVHFLIPPCRLDNALDVVIVGYLIVVCSIAFQRSQIPISLLAFKQQPWVIALASKDLLYEFRIKYLIAKVRPLF